ncbi:MAG TPA: hypothetical protein VFQ38_09615 [Longimicrobiales bacterium]|nr:hypothetical protein [Longimicrobiales bacterium]
MEWEKRPVEETPETTPRVFRDDRGRQWTGMVTSGIHEGGEEHAEALFVCNDVPSEVKRLARLDIPAGVVDERWRAMGEEEIREVFRRSEPA